MRIETKLDFKMYLNLMYTLTYRKLSMILVTIVGLVMFLESIPFFFGSKILFDVPPYFQLVFGFSIIAIWPFSIYRSGKKNFYSNGKLQEKTIYEFTDEGIKQIGETFNSDMDWTKVYNILELKDWILIYHNRQIANLIPKESFGDNLQDFKNLVISKGVKSKLIKGSPFPQSGLKKPLNN